MTNCNIAFETLRCLHNIFVLFENVLQYVLSHFHDFLRFGHNHSVQCVDKIYHEGTITGKNKHGCSVPVNIWISNWEGLSVMVTELKEDHQHMAPMKGKKSKTSPLLIKAHQRNNAHR